MPAKVVLMETDRDLRRSLAAALADAGHQVAVFCNSLTAFDALNHAKTAEVLITRVDCGRGRPHGVALARTARSRRQKISTIFLTEAHEAEFVRDDGAVVVKPVSPQSIVGIVNAIVSS